MATHRPNSTPYQFIKDGNLFIVPVGPSIDEVPYPTQSLTRAPDYSLWVNGRIQEPGFHLDHVRMPPSVYQDIRNDLVRYSPVEVSRSAFQRSQHAYVGVIDSKGTPYYFALDSRGISVREVDANDERVWKTFDRLADQERTMATQKRRDRADEEMTQVNRELSEPLLVIKADVGTQYAIEMARAARDIASQIGDDEAVEREEGELKRLTKGSLRYGKRADWHYDAPGSSWWRGAGEKKQKQPKGSKEPKPPKPSAEDRAAHRTKLHLEHYEARARGRQAVRDKLRAERGKKPAKPRADNSKLDAWKQKHPGGTVENMHAHPFAKALPKKAKQEKVKKPTSSKASKKVAGAGGKTRYSYPGEKKGGAKRPGAKKPSTGQVPLIVQHNDHKHADPSEFANQLGVSVRTLQRTAKKLGRESFVKFMRSHLKQFSAKHRLDPDYWGTLYERLRTTQVAFPS